MGGLPGPGGMGGLPGPGGMGGLPCPGGMGGLPGPGGMGGLSGPGGTGGWGVGRFPQGRHGGQSRPMHGRQIPQGWFHWRE